MTEVQWKIMFNVLIVIILLFTGFLIGRQTIDDKTKVVTKYIKGETQIDTLYYPKPYKVVEPIDTLSVIQQCIKDGVYKELWPERVVTEYVEVTKEDTTKIMNDWATKRYYSEILFQDDTKGYCKFDAEVQYNRLRLVGYEFTPVIKTVTETKYVSKTFSPFVGISFLVNPWDEIKNPMLQLNIGGFVKDNIGLQIMYQRGFKLENDFVGGGIIYKF
jgi:hypothetical protein